MSFRTFFIESYGCPMNMAESNALASRLQGIGLQMAEKAEDADLVVINTCSVRKTAENRIWGRLGFYAHLKKDHAVTLVVTGCMAQRLLDDLKKEAPQVDYVVGTNDKHKIIDIAQGKDITRSDTYEFDRLSWHPGDISSFVPIMNGCNNFCSYCIVPYVRGREVSRSVDDIIAEIRFLDAHGVKEVTLLGQNVNSYAYKREDGTVVRFPALLEQVAAAAGGIRWIRFDSPHPKDFSPDLIEVMAKNPKVADHVHIPLQSGSSRILKLMNRHYTKERFIALIDAMRGRIPSLTFAVDVMVGFPGETEADFHETLDVMGYMRPIEPFMYYYNPREGTRAVSMPGQISEDEKLRRLSELIEYEQIIVKEEKEKRLGSVVEVLVTQTSRHDEHAMLGHTEHNEMVVVPRCLPVGSLVKVRLDAIHGNTFQGSLEEA